MMNKAIWLVGGLASHAAAISAVVAALTLVKVSIEWLRKNRLERFEKYLEVSNFYQSHPTLSAVRAALFKETDTTELSNGDLAYFLAYFENVAMMMHSGLIRPTVVHYMFGYDILKAWRNESCMSRMNVKSSYLWTAFKSLAEEMECIDKRALEAHGKGRIRTPTF